MFTIPISSVHIETHPIKDARRILEKYTRVWGALDRFGEIIAPVREPMMQDVIQLRDPADRERANQILLETINRCLNEAETHILKGECMKTVAWFLKRQMSKGPTVS